MVKFSSNFLKPHKEKINNSKKVLEDFFKGCKYMGNPIVFNIAPYYLIGKGSVRIEKYFSNAYNALEIQIESIKEHIEKINDLYVPCLFPYLGVGVLASCFGGKVKFYKDKDPWLEEAVIKDYSDIDKLKKPNPLNTGLMKTVFEWMNIWKKETKGTIPLSLTDIQGPISIAIDLMGPEKFFLCIHDKPNKIHKLLNIITEFLIECLNISYRIIENNDDGNVISGIYILKECGKVRISEDNIVFLNEDVFEEFLKPYAERIFEEMNGGIIHWCGNGHQNLNSLLKINKLKGINNANLGRMNLIFTQSNIASYNNIIYQNEVVLPHPEWFKVLKRKLLSNRIIHHFILPIDAYGVSFNGYEFIGNDKLTIAKQLLKINENN